MPKQTRAELEQHLVDSIEFMVDANEKFDAGRLNYAKQLAVQIRLLVLHAGSAHALLEQLGYLTRWGWVDVANDIHPLNLAAEVGPVSYRMNSAGTDGGMSIEYAPVLDDLSMDVARRHSRFDTWWNRPVVKDYYRREFSRADIVLAVTHKDGGAHVDPKLPARLDALKNHGSFGFFTSSNPDGSSSLRMLIAVGDEPSPLRDWDSGDRNVSLARTSPIPALIRHFSYEILETVRQREPQIYERAMNAAT